MTLKEFNEKTQDLSLETELFAEYDGMIEPIYLVQRHRNALILFHEGYGSDSEYRHGNLFHLTDSIHLPTRLHIE